MWILAPLRAANKEGGSAGGESAATEAQNTPYFLTSGRCSLGRPTKKGGTTGKADIIILGDSSVSSLHAYLDITPGSTPDERPSITVTDNKSKFGTTLQGQKLPESVPTSLADGQDLRLGYKSKFRLVWQAEPLIHCPHPLGDLPAADLGHLLAQTGTTEAPWGPQVTYVLAAEGQPLSAAALCAALQGVPLVGVSWLQALGSKTAWKAELPGAEEHRVSRFAYLSSSGMQGQQQQQELDLAAWAAAGGCNLLQGFSFLVDAGQAALLELCILLGAQAATTASTPHPTPSQLYIISSNGSGESKQPQRHGKAASVPEQVLLACVVQRDVAVLRQQLEQHAESIAAAEDHSETIATSGHGTSSEAGEHDEAEVTGLLLPVNHTQRRAAAAAHAAAAAAAAVAAPAAAVTPPRSKQRRGAGAAASPASATRGKSRKREQQAGAAEIPATPPSKRRKGRAAAAAVEAAPMEVHPPPPAAEAQVPPDSNTTAAAARGGGRSRHGSKVQPARGTSAAAASEQGVVMMDLVAPNLPPNQHVAHHQEQQQQQAVVNFKAFRRKGQAAATIAAAVGPAVVVGVEPFSADDAHPDTELFLREEEQRRKRMQKADELFNAAVGPSKNKAGAGARSSRR